MKERLVCECLLKAMTNEEIAKELGMASRTVKQHFNRMFMKAGITTGIRRVKLAVILYHQFEEEEKCQVLVIN